MHSGDFGLGLEVAQRFRHLASSRCDPTDLAIGDRMVGVSSHYRGDQGDARHHIEQMLAHYVAPVRRSPSTRFVYDQRAIARVALGRILWVQGFPDQAWSIAHSSVEEALALNNPFHLCFTLTETACPVAFFIGDLVAAERYATMLLDCSSNHELPMWRSYGRRFQATLLIRKGDLDGGLRLLRTSLDQPPDADFQPRFAWFLAQLAEGFRCAGQVAEGTVTINEAIARSERNEDRWCLAEVLRIKGDLAQSESGTTSIAESLFLEALDVARGQGAVSFELRAATSLARLLRDRGRSSDALACLRKVYDRFTEGFDTVDLKKAKLLLDSF
jgi:hypothetical protein